MSDSLSVPVTSERRSFKYSGNGSELALLMLQNLLFTVFTLGIYRAWGKTKVRRYFWGHVTFEGDRATYLGTGSELFRGWIKLIGLLLVVVFCAQILIQFSKFFSLVVPLAYVVVFGLAVYSGLRYRLSRTTWRGIRFGVDKDKESTREFISNYLWWTFLQVISLGIYVPFAAYKQRQFLTNRCRFGSSYFSYEGDAWEYAGVFFRGLLLTVLTLGVYYPWWLLTLAKYRAEHTRFQNARFEVSLSGGDLLVFSLIAFFGALLSLGLASPWIINRGMHLFINNTHLVGSFDMSHVRAVESSGSAMADDIVDGYDLDLGF